jgi:hypothetical protein
MSSSQQHMYRVDSFMNSQLSKNKTLVQVQIALPNTNHSDSNYINNIIQIVLEYDKKHKESYLYSVNYRGASVSTYSMENIQVLFKITGFGILTRENVIFDKDYINKEEFFNFIGI